jgi:hypothetical protein
MNPCSIGGVFVPVVLAEGVVAWGDDISDMGKVSKDTSS